MYKIGTQQIFVEKNEQKELDSCFIYIFAMNYDLQIAMSQRKT